MAKHLYLVTIKGYGHTVLFGFYNKRVWPYRFICFFFSYFSSSSNGFAPKFDCGRLVGRSDGQPVGRSGDGPSSGRMAGRSGVCADNGLVSAATAAIPVAHRPLMTNGFHTAGDTQPSLTAAAVHELDSQQTSEHSISHLSCAPEVMHVTDAVWESRWI